MIDMNDADVFLGVIEERNKLRKQLRTEIKIRNDIKKECDQLREELNKSQGFSELKDKIIRTKENTIAKLEAEKAEMLGLLIDEANGHLNAAKAEYGERFDCHTRYDDYQYLIGKIEKLTGQEWKELSR